MKDIMFFDAHTQIGTPRNGALECTPTVPDLLKEMDRSGVDKALVYDINLRIIGVVMNNDRVNQFMKDDVDGRLTGVWSFILPHTNEIPEQKEFFAQMGQNRVKALIPDPNAHSWIANRMTIGKFMDEAAERKIPMLVRPDAFKNNWDGLYSFIHEFPKNTYILVTTWLYWGTDRLFRPLLENYEKMHLEFSTYWNLGGIEDLVNTYGAKRILYGSGYPAFNHGNMMTALKHAGISDDEKCLIAGRNLENLLNEVEL